uniref:Uncharacterized protein n=1 Tax=Glossina austeni TaxID=7395 RepID=A0A1A9UQ29_GLOAU
MKFINPEFFLNFYKANVRNAALSCDFKMILSIFENNYVSHEFEIKLFSEFFHFSRLKSEDMQKHLNIRLDFLIRICCSCCSVAFVMVLCYNNNFKDDIGALLTRHETRHRYSSSSTLSSSSLSSSSSSSSLSSHTFSLRVGISRVLLQYVV